MPRVEFSIPIAGSDCRIGLWKMTESEEELYAGVPELIRYRHVVCNMKSSARRLEFLCVRSFVVFLAIFSHFARHLAPLNSSQNKKNLTQKYISK